MCEFSITEYLRATKSFQSGKSLQELPLQGSYPRLSEIYESGWELPWVGLPQNLVHKNLSQSVLIMISFITTQ